MKKTVKIFVVLLYLILSSCQKNIYQDVIDRIDALPEDISYNDFTAVNEVIEMYNELPNSQKENVVNYQDFITKLESLNYLIPTSVQILYNDISYTNLTINCGEEVTLALFVAPSLEYNAIWESTNEEVATVSNGIVTTKTIGKTTISATVNGVKSSLEVEVIEEKIEYQLQILINEEEVTTPVLYKDVNAKYKFNVTPLSSIDNIIYDKEYLEIKDDVIIPLKAGNTTIEIKVAEQSFIVNITIIDSNLQIMLQDEPIEELKLLYGDEVNLNATFNGSVTTAIIWNSTLNNTVENGIIFADAIGEGVIILTHTLSQKTKEIPLIVYPRVLLSIDAICYVDEKMPLTIKTIPEDCDEFPVTITTEQNATIENGYFTASLPGIYQIRVSCYDEAIYQVNAVRKTVNTDVTLQYGISLDMTSPYYWIKNNHEYQNIIKSNEEIDAINQKAYTTNGTNLVDVNNIPDEVKGSSVLANINSYQFNSSYYINGFPAPTNYASELIKKQNISNIVDSVKTQFGLIKTFCSLRSFPTSDLATRSSSIYDRFQETGLNVGEMVAIYHTSLDGEWLFVQATNYYGWVEKENILITSKQDALQFVTNPEFVVVISERTTVNDTVVRMGSRLPLVDEEKMIVQIPTAGGIENYQVTSSDFSVGYLPYTTENILLQAFKLLHNPYSWGDGSIMGRDCSSTMNAVYHCFGFVMPRNTGNQQKIPLKGIDCRSYGATAKNSILDNLAIGSLVFSSGHVMMYLGKIGSSYYVLHNSQSVGNYVNISILNVSSMIAILEMK